MSAAEVKSAVRLAAGSSPLSLARSRRTMFIPISRGDFVRKAEQLIWPVALVMAAVLVATASASVKAQGSSDTVAQINDMNRRVIQLHKSGKYVEAIPLAKRSADATRGHLGPQSAEYAAALNNLALLYNLTDRKAEAEPLYVRALAIAEKVSGANHPDVGSALNNLASLHYDRGRYLEAERLYKRALMIYEKAWGPDHADVSLALGNLGALYEKLGRYTEAERHYKRNLALGEKSLRGDHSTIATRLSSLAGLYVEQGRYADAEALYNRSVAILEKGLGLQHPRLAIALGGLATLYRLQGRYRDAEILHKRSLAISEKALGLGHSAVGTSLNNLGLLYLDQYRFAEAEPLLQRSLAIAEKVNGPNHASVSFSLENIARLRRESGQYDEAERLQKRSLAIREKALGPGHPEVGTSLNNLAHLYSTQARHLAEAERLYRQGLAIAEKTLGSDHPSVAISLGNLGAFYHGQGRRKEAEALYARALKISEKTFGSDHTRTAHRLLDLGMIYHDQQRATAEVEALYKRALAIFEGASQPDRMATKRAFNNLAVLYDQTGRATEAEPLHRQALTLTEQALGPSHPDVALSLNNLAVFLWEQGSYAEAEALHKRALAIVEQTLGPDHPAAAYGLANRAALRISQGDWPGAVADAQRSADITTVRLRHGANVIGQELASTASHTARIKQRFSTLVKAAWQLTSPDERSKHDLGVVMFRTAQWAQASEAAASLAQMAARSAKGDVALGQVVRQRQDLVDEWRRSDKSLVDAISQTAGRRHAPSEENHRARLAAISTQVAAIDKTLAKQFPDYAAFASPEPLSITEVQALLRPDEALVLFLDTYDSKPLVEETFIWVVTATETRWVRSELGTPALAREVAALRCGLDHTAWTGTRCHDLTGRTYAIADHDDGTPPPFDPVRAHALYNGLLSQVEDLVRGRHLLLVLSGPLTQLPLQVLVTAKPEREGLKSVAWLARAHALTVLPSVSSLQALRRNTRPSVAPLPIIGFGNPLLDGPDKRYAAIATQARDNQRCPDVPNHRVARRLGAAFPLTTRAGRIDLADLRRQVPLPETADELCRVAQDLGADSRDVHLGARATEREIKKMSLSGELSQYRIIHFATHGALAGQLTDATEPGLILTPPEQATDEDDGYLSASEIASLKLDADLVILSACNTAAGGANGAEALSGLARAFVYAQSRALLVSHWEVNSEATVKLITGVVREISNDRSVGRGEALRRAMLSLVDTDAHAHPAYWAPFVVVGEGAAVR